MDRLTRGPDWREEAGAFRSCTIGFSVELPASFAAPKKTWCSATFGAVLAGALFAACPGPAVDCRVGSDCVSGVCRGDGTCAPEGTGGGGQTGGGVGATGGGSTGGGGSATGGSQGTGGGAAATGGGGGTVLCAHNDDQRIERSEVTFRAGLHATYRVSGATTFATAGSTVDGGAFWNFDVALDGDAPKIVETTALTGQWFESDFPDAGYTSLLDEANGLLGVFGATSDGLYLQGVVSQADGTFGTKVTYTPWIPVLRFPLESGATWTTTTTVDGKYMGGVIGYAAYGTGLPFQQERYTSKVDRVGTAQTPFATFETLRVSTVMERQFRTYTLQPWVTGLTLRTFTWNAECLGTVATVTSQDNETTTDFTSAAEVRRLSP